MKLLIALLLASVMLAAAPWDGTKGDFTITTSTFPGIWGPAPASNTPNMDRNSLFIKVTCSNPAVSAVRISVTIAGAGFPRTQTQLVQLNALRSGIALFPDATEANVSAPLVTPLFDGVSIQF